MDFHSSLSLLMYDVCTNWSCTVYNIFMPRWLALLVSIRRTHWSIGAVWGCPWSKCKRHIWLKPLASIPEWLLSNVFYLHPFDPLVVWVLVESISPILDKYVFVPFTVFTTLGPSRESLAEFSSPRIGWYVNLEYNSIIQWIGWREHIYRKPFFVAQIYGFLQIFPFNRSPQWARLPCPASHAAWQRVNMTLEVSGPHGTGPF